MVVTKPVINVSFLRREVRSCESNSSSAARSESKYSAAALRLFSHISFELGLSGCLYPWPMGFLEFNMSNSLAIVLMKITVD
jgi:hypothetical protein